MSKKDLMNADAFRNEKISTDKNEILNIGSLFNLKFRKSIIVRISRIIFPQTRPDLDELQKDIMRYFL